MVELMSVMNQRPEKEVFEEVALLKSIDPSFIEKDWFVTQIIAVLADHHAVAGESELHCGLQEYFLMFDADRLHQSLGCGYPIMFLYHQNCQQRLKKFQLLNGNLMNLIVEALNMLKTPHQEFHWNG